MKKKIKNSKKFTKLLTEGSETWSNEGELAGFIRLKELPSIKASFPVGNFCFFPHISWRDLWRNLYRDIYSCRGKKKALQKSAFSSQRIGIRVTQQAINVFTIPVLLRGTQQKSTLLCLTAWDCGPEGNEQTPVMTSAFKSEVVLLSGLCLLKGRGRITERRFLEKVIFFW